MATREAGYERELAIGYLESVGTRREDGKFYDIDGVLVTDNHRQTISKWERLDVVPLGRFDAILVAYGLMLWQYEDWAKQTHGWDGYVEPVMAA